MKEWNTKLINILGLQGAIVIFTFAGVLAKLASNEEFMSISFLVYLGLQFSTLVIYALLWVKIIAKFDLSVAYMNKGAALLWSTVWSYVIFSEPISYKQGIGIATVLVGIIVINIDSVRGTGDVIQ